MASPKKEHGHRTSAHKSSTPKGAKTTGAPIKLTGIKRSTPKPSNAGVLTVGAATTATPTATTPASGAHAAGAPTPGEPAPQAAHSPGSTPQSSGNKKPKTVQAKLNLGNPKPGSNLAKIAAHPIQREVFFRSTGEQAKRDQKMLDGGRVDYQCAVQITARGERNETCLNCKIGRGKFTACAAIPGLFDGACGNCVYGGEYQSCANVNDGKIPAKGMKRFGLTPTDVGRRLGEMENRDYQPPKRVRSTPQPRAPETTEKPDPNCGSEFFDDGVRASKRLKTRATTKKI